MHASTDKGVEAHTAHTPYRFQFRDVCTCRLDNAESGTLEEAWDECTGALVSPPPAAAPPPTQAAAPKATLKRSNSAVRAMKKVESMLSRGASAESSTLDLDSYYSSGSRGLKANSVAAALADLGAC